MGFGSALVRLSGALALSAGIVAVAQGAELGATGEPIKLALNEWTGQHITTKVAGEILERMGYEVEYVTAGYYPQMTAIRDNEITATLEVWSSNIGAHYRQALDSGRAVALGDLGLTPVETWYYNAAAAQACPALPDWRALAGCAEVFATADTIPAGRLLDYPADWGTNNADRLHALALPIEAVPAQSEGALVAEILAADSAHRPLLVQFWSPHWVHAEVDLRVVELPPFEEGCDEDPTVGLNPTAVYDCDWPRGRVTKLAWIGLQETWPAAYRLLIAYQLRNEDQIPMIKAIDQDGEDLDSVAAGWVDENRSVWQPWVEAATR